MKKRGSGSLAWSWKSITPFHHAMEPMAKYIRPVQKARVEGTYDLRERGLDAQGV